MSSKFVLIGGGSFAWTSHLVTDIACLPELKGMQLVLHDINPKTLKIMHPLCQKISDGLNADLQIESTTDLDSALQGADFVGLTINTGGHEASQLDCSIPAKYGIYQTVGDSVGPGGWCRALRNIPIVVDIARKVEAIAPDAWFFNYTNPMTTLTRAIQRETSLKSVGLCHELQGFLLHVAAYLGVDWEKDIRVKMGGINHLIWLLEMDVCGQDGLQLLKEYHRAPEEFKPLKKGGIPEALKEAGGVNPNQTIKFDWLERTGMMTGAGDGHTAEFFSHYLKNDESLKKWGFFKEKAHTFAMVGSYDDKKRNVEALLSGETPLWLKHSHEHASRIMAALLGRHGDFITPVNTANVGQIDNLPRDVVVETLAVVNSMGVQPIAVGALPDFAALHCMRHIPTQEMIVEAGLTGNKELAVLALSQDPLIPTPDIAKKIAEDFFEEFKEWLPQFNGEWS